MFQTAYEDMYNNLKKGQASLLLTQLKPLYERGGDIEKKEIFNHQQLIQSNLPKELQKKINSTFETGKPMMATYNDKSLLVEPFFPKPRLIILGGGHIAKPLSEFGAKVGFSIVVSDDRPSFANPDRFPNADEVICEGFEAVFDQIEIRPSDFVVIVTRGHRHDGICIRRALNYSPTYIGMIGSKRRVKEMLQQLMAEGYPKEKLEALHSPIGLSIGAVTPEEIAISIISECIGVRRSSSSSALVKSTPFCWPEFDQDVMREMAYKSEAPCALITIIASRGSVPRKAGAKMITWLDGRVMGSIGGGCSEANILTLAREVILHKGYRIEHVDMTGDVAEDEGMVCGGMIDVLIEAF